MGLNLLRATVLTLAISTCAAWNQRRASDSPDIVVTSFGSLYSPVGNFPTFVEIERNRIILRIDSAVIAAPGVAIAGAPPAFRRLQLAALIATDEANAGGWKVVASSAPVAIVDELRFGETRTIARLRFEIPRSTNLSLEKSWIVYRFTGVAITRLSGDQPLETHACASRNISGPPSLSERRAARLKANYLAAC